jgi:glyoxylate/hydroxypyruvate reductase A
MSLLICLPDSFEPRILCSSLQSLDPELKIEIGPENVQNPAEVEFAVVWNHPQGLLLKYPNLQAISSYGHGADGLLADKKLPEGVPIVRLTNETMANWLSEYLLAVVLLKRRQLLEHASNPEFVEWGTAARHPGNQLGILGLGYLGKAAAKVFLQMGFDVAGWSRTLKQIEGVSSYSGRDGLTEMLNKTDYLVNILPLTDETLNLLNTETLSQLKRGAYFINVGRGQTLVEEDLIPLLDAGQLSGACLDVFRTEPLAEGHPFRKHKKILITPHNSCTTPPEAVAPQIYENYKRAISGRQLLNLVDLKHGY